MQKKKLRDVLQRLLSEYDTLARQTAGMGELIIFGDDWYEALEEARQALADVEDD